MGVLTLVCWALFDYTHIHTFKGNQEKEKYNFKLKAMTVFNYILQASMWRHLITQCYATIKNVHNILGYSSLIVYAPWMWSATPLHEQQQGV